MRQTTRDAIECQRITRLSYFRDVCEATKTVRGIAGVSHVKVIFMSVVRNLYIGVNAKIVKNANQNGVCLGPPMSNCLLTSRDTQNTTCSDVQFLFILLPTVVLFFKQRL